MTRKNFLKSLGALAGSVALATTGLGGGMKAFGATLFAGKGLLGAGKRRFSIVYALGKIGEMTPDQLDRALFESGISEPFDLGGELSKMVEEGVLTQSVGAEGLVYRSVSEAVTDSIGAEGMAKAEGVTKADLAEIDARLTALKADLEAEKDYMALYTESSTGMVPVFLSIREGASIKMKLNLVVPDVATAKVVTRNWRKNAHKAHRAAWEAISEGMPFPDFSSIRKID